MKENKYDDAVFFDKYKNMERSKKGLDGAGEWHALKKMLPDFRCKRVLDLGCGFGWHCAYAIENGAASVVGVDISEKMLEEARAKNGSEKIEYICMPIEDVHYTPDSFDVVLSSLAFHYVQSFDAVCKQVSHCLIQGGDFVFSVEHPVFTAYGSQDWCYSAEGEIDHWPVDRYFLEGERKAVFWGEEVVKYHRTLTGYLQTLLENGFEITGLIEPQPDASMLDTVPGMRDELRRPMMLLLAAKKK